MLTLLTSYTTTSNVSIYAALFSARMGIQSYVSTTRPERVDALHAAGIAVEPLPDHRQVDGAIHTYGDLNNTMATIRTGGMLSFVSPAGGTTAIDPLALFANNIQLRAVALGTVEHTRQAVSAAQDLAIPVEAMFGFADVPRAFAQQRLNSRPGKILISVSSTP